MRKSRRMRQVEYAVRAGCIVALNELAASMRRGEPVTPEVLEVLALEFEESQRKVKL